MRINRDEFFMARALELARKGWGRTNPNPLVGAVIVKNASIIAEGFHHAVGSPHAEVDAFAHADADARGGTLYVNLEPCCHYGRTPPCTDAIIRAGISRVVVAMPDPNPRVAGNGIRLLREAGIDVTVGILEREARQFNEIFVKFITSNRPFVLMKCAMTLDGKIASVTGDSKWISSESSRNYVHALRDRFAAIMVGIGTVMQDNPTLTTRLASGRGKDALRIVVDSAGRIPLDANVITTPSNAGMLLATTDALPAEKEAQLIESGARIVKMPAVGGHVDLNALMSALHASNIDSVLLEGGGTLNAAALQAGIVDKVMLFIAPKLIGGEQAVTPVGGAGIARMADALRIHNLSVARYDDDVLIEGYL